MTLILMAMSANILMLLICNAVINYADKPFEERIKHEGGGE